MENILFLVFGSLLTLLGLAVKWYLLKQDRLEQYTSVSIEKRLETHQKAFALTYEIKKGASSEKFETIFNKCQQWWNENNFYLEPKSRKAFRNCYWELLIFQKKKTGTESVDRRLRFFETVLPETRKILTEEIGFTWLGEKENSVK
jgi:hypothetical protein